MSECEAEKQNRVLIVSSDAAFRMRWSGHPPYEGKVIEEAAGGADALAKLDSANWGEVLLDCKLHDLDVDEVLRTIQSRHPNLQVRLVDSQYELKAEPDCFFETRGEPGVHGVDGSLADERSFEIPLRDEIFKVVEEEAQDLSRRQSEPLPGMPDAGPGLEEVFRLARLVGVRRTTVLITGETGTGKELVARGIHEISPRAKGPFIVVNCAAIPEPLLEAELFGHARGAFTGAVQSRLGRLHAAHGGTLFLDEVGELPLSMQAKILRFLQDGEVQRLGSADVFRVDVRVISATNVDLLGYVREAKFRQDLYYRLAVFPLELPPLRQRKAQIVPLAELFLSTLCEQSSVPRKGLSPAAAAFLKQHTWAGNVRELQHTIERAFILSEDQRQLRPEHFSSPESSPVLRKV